MRRAVAVLLVLALATAVLAWPAAKLLDAALGTDAIVLVSENDAAKVELQRLAFDDEGLTPEQRTEAVVSIYGAAPRAAPDRFLGVTDADLIRPAEAPELVLLRPREGGWRQTKTLYFVAERAIVAGLVGAAALFLVRRFTGGSRAT